jgi:hypothetical protein
MFRAARKTAYEDVLPLPRIEDAADRVRKCRVLLIVSPDSKIPPKEVQKFFDGRSQKYNLCVLTGDKTSMGCVEKAVRQLYAVQKAEGRIPKDHPQREDLEKKQQTYELDFTATILNLFDKVFFPIYRAGKPAQLASNPLDMSRNTKKNFDGEALIEKTLTSNPQKLFLDVEKEFDPICSKAQDLLWPKNRLPYTPGSEKAESSEGLHLLRSSAKKSRRRYGTETSVRLSRRTPPAKASIYKPWEHSSMWTCPGIRPVWSSGLAGSSASGRQDEPWTCSIWCIMAPRMKKSTGFCPGKTSSRKCRNPGSNRE